ncbi:hypothetical protein [Candidatus Electronema sp. PJ]|uniref:hypothetical protein n=1 Tax=Candidatus Electronema sp. PJ TaxID=3401572 RepID=UPI003AA91212
MLPETRALLIEDELVLLADSGELPEVAYHSALWHLCGNSDGPHLLLTEAEKQQLQDAALRRWQQIILRDLDPARRDCRSWRGPLRSFYNWERYLTFCQRIRREPDASFRERVATALTTFLSQEITDQRSGTRPSSLNCSNTELLTYACQLGLAEDTLPADWNTLWSEENRN